MAAIVIVSTAGAAAILYYGGWSDVMKLAWPFRFGNSNRIQPVSDAEAIESQEEDDNVDEIANQRRQRIYRVQAELKKPSRPPSSWTEAMSLLASSLRFAYSETLGKWPLHHLAFGINYLLRRQGELHVEGIYADEHSYRLTGPQAVADLRDMAKLIWWCYLFSKKSFDVFLSETGLSSDDVLMYQGKAALLKPAFSILLDHSMERILLMVRGTHSLKDTLTVVTGASVPFHHTVVEDGSGVTHCVLGYAHCGMVAAARSLAQQTLPTLQAAMARYPHYKVKTLGHSLGGGTAALLTFVLREMPGFGDTSCYSFATAACMTWELAESGSHCVTSIVNGSDLVPTFSAASADDLRAEVTASKWVSELQHELEKMRIYRLVLAMASTLRTRLAKIRSATSSMSRQAKMTLSLAQQVRRSPCSSDASREACSGAVGIMTWLRSPSANTKWGSWKEEQQQQEGGAAETDDSPSLFSSNPGSSSDLFSSSVSQPDRDHSTRLWSMWSCMRGRQEQSSDAEEGGFQTDDEAEGAGDDHVITIGTLSPVKSMKMDRGSGDGRPRSLVQLCATEREEAAGLAALLQAMEEGGEEDCDREGEGPSGEENDSHNLSWEELEAELSRKLDSTGKVETEEEAAMAREITLEEEEVASHATSSEMAVERASEELDEFLRDPRRFFPCGRIIHLIRSSKAVNSEESAVSSEVDLETGHGGEMDVGPRSTGTGSRMSNVGAFVTDRSNYGRVRLSRSMVYDHFMPNYKKSMLEIADRLEAEMG